MPFIGEEFMQNPIQVSSLQALQQAANNANGPVAVIITSDFTGNGTVTIKFDFAVLGNFRTLTSVLTFVGAGNLYIEDLSITKGCLHASDISGDLFINRFVSVSVTGNSLDGITAKNMFVMPSSIVLSDGGNATGRGILISNDMSLEVGSKVACKGGISSDSNRRSGNGLEVRGSLTLLRNAKLNALGGSSSVNDGGQGVLVSKSIVAREGSEIIATGGNGLNVGGNGILIGTLDAPGPLVVPTGEFPMISARGGGKINSAPASGGNGICTSLSIDAYVLGDFTVDSSYEPLLVEGLPGGFTIYNKYNGGDLYVIGMIKPEPISLYFGNGVNAKENVFFVLESVIFELNRTSLILNCNESSSVVVTQVLPSGSIFKSFLWVSHDSNIATVEPSTDGLSGTIRAVGNGKTTVYVLMRRPDGTDVIQNVEVEVRCRLPKPTIPCNFVCCKRKKRPYSILSFFL